MAENPTTAQIEELERDRRLLHRLAVHTEDPQVHVFAVLKFIAIDLLSQLAIDGGSTNG